jgi:hypothetical protein
MVQLFAARSLFGEYLGAVAAEKRATTAQVRGEMLRHVGGVLARISAADELASYFDGRRMAGDLRGSLDATLERVSGLIDNTSPLWLAGFADGLLEQVGAL